MQARDSKMLQMIVGTVTPDGVLNLQAKSITQSRMGSGSAQVREPAANGELGSSEERDISGDSAGVENSNDRSLDLGNIFGARALRYA